ncbi:hypothetical protein NQ317_007724 [Molorchus minor]|uniref:Uncharacterized protein n=1 Tax=Molorchus minor TaxID=1323400 RepID=A0ABQ9JVZ1_9CUCU|nr:hypothetical protein NQ317_007724 [Molorchus minor]
MRIYKLDGTFVDNRDDTEFGWSFGDITEDSVNASNEAEEDPHTCMLESVSQDLESPDGILPNETLVVNKINTNIKIHSIIDVVDCKMEIEGISVKANEPNILRELKNIDVCLPSKEKLANLITPCNSESKLLLSIIYFAKFNTLTKTETSEGLFKTVNFRTTNYKHLINDVENSMREEMYKEIQEYHATKEDNMLSLMMELVLADINSNLEDIVDVNQSDNESGAHFVAETSDLGNSIQSSCSSKEENPDKSNYLQVPNRSDVLSNIGLSDEDNSIQSFSEETFEMHLQLDKIKKSLHEEEHKVNELIKTAAAVGKELKETQYLDDILHLLNGEIEKVKYKKLPFRLFHKSEEDFDLNLIV